MKFILGYESECHDELVQYITISDADYNSEEWCVVEADSLEEAELKYEETFLAWQKSGRANWTVEKKDEIEGILIGMWASIGMDIPDNYEDIVQECYEDVCSSADPENWHSGDVAIAFRRWIENQSKDN